MTRKTPLFEYEQVALNESSRDRADLPELEARLTDIEASNRQILAVYRPEDMAQAISRRAARGRSLSAVWAALGKGIAGLFAPRRALLPAFGLGLAVVLAAFVALPMVMNPGLQDDPQTLRAKGGQPRLLIYRGGAGSVEELQDGATVRERDLLQVSYIASGKKYGAIVSVDGGGAVTVHFPPQGYMAGALENRGEILLPFSYKLDSAPHFERFYFVAADQAFPLAKVRAVIAAIGPQNLRDRDILPIGPDFIQHSLVFIKE